MGLLVRCLVWYRSRWTAMVVRWHTLSLGWTRLSWTVTRRAPLLQHQQCSCKIMLCAVSTTTTESKTFKSWNFFFFYKVHLFFQEWKPAGRASWRPVERGTRLQSDRKAVADHGVGHLELIIWYLFFSRKVSTSGGLTVRAARIKNAIGKRPDGSGYTFSFVWDIIDKK